MNLYVQVYGVRIYMLSKCVSLLPTQTRQLYFVTESAVFELFKFAAHYSEELMEALNEDGLITLAAKFGELTQSFKVKS